MLKNFSALAVVDGVVAVVKEESPKPILQTVNVEEKLQEKLLFSYDQTQDVNLNVNVNSLDCSSLQASNAKKRKTSNLCQTIENGMQCATKNAGELCAMLSFYHHGSLG